MVRYRVLKVNSSVLHINQERVVDLGNQYLEW